MTGQLKVLFINHFRSVQSNSIRKPIPDRRMQNIYLMSLLK
ncbi:Uncharacterised protein [Mycobacteroides abscessus subsp. abscessus]|nr:Uncharacterised protein [Mycobacteroides abscessus subsp. abscessus]